MSAPTIDVPVDGAEELGGKPNPGTKKDKRLHENDKKPKMEVVDVATFAVTGGDGKDDKKGGFPFGAEQWSGVLIVEGTPTGDGREFATDAISWPDPNDVTLTLQWQKESSHGGDHDVTVAVGRITRVWRDGNLIRGAGNFDLGGPADDDGHEAFRRMNSGMLTGVSINADDITDADVEYIWPAGTGEAADEDDIMALLFGRPEKVVFHKARLRAATLCDIPAYVEAVLHTVDPAAMDAVVASAATAVREAATVPPHTSTTSDLAWNGPEVEAMMPADMSQRFARQHYAWVDPGADGERVSREQCRFLHHVGAAANLAACRVGIGVLNADMSLPEDERRGVYEHLAGHLRDAQQQPEQFQAKAVTAAAYAATEIWRAPHAWFSDPGITVPTPIIVNDSGRVFGLASEWGQCHLGYQNECVMAPREDFHAYYLTGNQPLDNGADVPVGQITAGIGHASLTIGSWQKAAEHYDNTDAVVANVTMGNCKAGIWVAGAVLPWANAARVAALRSSGQVSPDWRRIGGQMRMVGLLTVNVSGFQTPTAAGNRPRVRTHIAASGQMDAMVASGMVSARLTGEVSEAELDRRALRLMQDKLAARVHREG